MTILECQTVSYLPLTFSQSRWLSPVRMEIAVVVKIENRLVGGNGGARAEVTQSVGRVHYQDRRGRHLR